MLLLFRLSILIDSQPPQNESTRLFGTTGRFPMGMVKLALIPLQGILSSPFSQLNLITKLCFSSVATQRQSLWTPKLSSGYALTATCGRPDCFWLLSSRDLSRSNRPSLAVLNVLLSSWPGRESMPSTNARCNIFLTGQKTAPLPSVSSVPLVLLLDSSGGRTFGACIMYSLAYDRECIPSLALQKDLTAVTLRWLSMPDWISAVHNASGCTLYDTVATSTICRIMTC